MVAGWARNVKCFAVGCWGDGPDVVDVFKLVEGLEHFLGV